MKKIYQLLMTIALMLWGLGATPSLAQMPSYDDVLLVINQNSPISQQIGNYYLSQRPIPSSNVCYIHAPDQERIEQAVYDSIESEIRACLLDQAIDDTINYIVTTKGTPLIFNSDIGSVLVFGGVNLRPQRSVDSFLTTVLADEEFLSQDNRLGLDNPFSAFKTSFSHANPKFKGIYLVNRLTGYNFVDVKRLIDQATASFFPLVDRSSEQVLLDEEPDAFNGLFGVTSALEEIEDWEHPYIYGSNEDFLTGINNISLGFSMGHNDNYSPVSTAWGLNFRSGAIFETAVSYGGRTFNLGENGGLYKYHNGTINKVVPLTSENLPIRNLGQLIKIGNTLYCGTSAYQFNEKRKKKGSGIYLFDLFTESLLPTVYTSENTGGGLVNDYILDFLHDSSRNLLWVATADGVSSLDLSSGLWLAHETGYEARKLALDNGDLWIPTPQGLRHYEPDTGNVTVYTTINSGLPTDDTTSIAIHPMTQTKWIGTTTGLVEFDGINWTVHSFNDSEYHDHILTTLLDGDILWVGTKWTGFKKFNTQTHTHEKFYNQGGFISKTVYAMALHEDQLVIGTKGTQKHLTFFDKMSTFTDGPSTGETVSDIVSDGDTLWIAKWDPGQSLVADTIHDGVTGIKAYVNEPFGVAIAHPHRLFPRYMNGYNLAESFYGATSLIQWMDVVIGDPKVQMNDGDKMPDINFALLENTFVDRRKHTIVDSPVQIRGRAAVKGGGTGTWELRLHEFLLDSGPTNSERMFESILLDLEAETLPVPKEEFELKLLVYHQGEVVAEDKIEIHVPFDDITSPSPGMLLNSNSVIEIAGTIRQPYDINYQFLPHYYYRNGEAVDRVGLRSGVTLASSGPVINGTLGYIDINEALNAAGDESTNLISINLDAITSEGNHRAVSFFVFIDDEMESNWPQKVEKESNSVAWETARLFLADLNQDGKDEIIQYFGGGDSHIRVFDQGGVLNEALYELTGSLIEYGARFIVAANVDDDPNDLELIRSSISKFNAFEQTGEPVSSWTEQQFNDLKNTGLIYSAPGDREFGLGLKAIDFDNDGKDEFLTLSFQANQNPKRLYVSLYDSDATLVEENYFETTTSFSGAYSDPFMTLTDLENDGQKELVLVYKYSDTQFFIRMLSLPNLSEVYSPIVRSDPISDLKVYDFDNDGNKEIIVEEFSAENIVDPKIPHVAAVYLLSGALYSGWTPTVPTHRILSFDDVDQDGNDDVIASYFDQIIVMSKTGQAKLGWESNRIYWDTIDSFFEFNPAAIIQNAYVRDLDNDGETEVIAVGVPGSMHTNENLGADILIPRAIIQVWNSDGTPWEEGWWKAFNGLGKEYSLEDFDNDGVMEFIALNSVTDDPDDAQNIGAIAVWSFGEDNQPPTLNPVPNPLVFRVGSAPITNSTIFTSDPEDDASDTWLSYEVTGLPAGATFGPHPDGTLNKFRLAITSSTPLGDYPAMITVTDSGGLTDQKSFTLRVENSCFIATAAYGTPMHEDIDVLRQYRDDVMLKSEFGSKLVETYYKYSPPIADKIAEREWTRGIVRGALKPIIKAAEWWMQRE